MPINQSNASSVSTTINTISTNHISVIQPKITKKRVQKKTIIKQCEQSLDIDTTQAITQLMSQPNVMEIFNKMGRSKDPTEIAKLNQSLQAIIQPVLQNVNQKHANELFVKLNN